jgi:hypothetical protein
LSAAQEHAVAADTAGAGLNISHVGKSICGLNEFDVSGIIIQLN